MGPGLKIFSIIGILVVVSAAVAWYLYPKPTEYNESFEESFGGWIKDADVPPDPNNPGHLVAWNISRAASQAYLGQYSVEMYIDGRQDDGTIWMEKKLSAEKKSQIQVKISFKFYSKQESFNIIAGVCAYSGIHNPEAEANFTVIGNANEISGWKHYTYQTTLTTDPNGEIWVALGITVRWETEMTYNLDDVTVTIS